MENNNNNSLVPKLRFPGFEGEWEEKTLGEVCELKNGYAFKSDSYVKNGKYTVITIANVQNGQLVLNEVNTIEDLPDNIAEHQKLKLGDIIMSMTGNVGRVCIIDKPNCLLNQRVGLLEQKNDTISRPFLFCLLNSERFETAMKKCGQGAAQANISKSDIESFVLMIPPTSAEQQKIADCLSSLDDQIAAESAKLEALKDHKKGLMQQLFPNPSK